VEHHDGDAIWRSRFQIPDLQAVCANDLTADARWKVHASLLSGRGYLNNIPRVSLTMSLDYAVMDMDSP
jgi:hypothetical protein